MIGLTVHLPINCKRTVHVDAARQIFAVFVEFDVFTKMIIWWPQLSVNFTPFLLLACLLFVLLRIFSVNSEQLMYLVFRCLNAFSNPIFELNFLTLGCDLHLLITCKVLCNQTDVSSCNTVKLTSRFSKITVNQSAIFTEKRVVIHKAWCPLPVYFPTINFKSLNFVTCVWPEQATHQINLKTMKIMNF